MIMSFKEALKMKLPFTRKGLEDYLDEKLALMQCQIAEEMNAQLHRRINDLQSAVIQQLTQELNAQLHRRANDLDRAISNARDDLYGFSRRLPRAMLSFEVALAEHCNLNCVGCSHFSPLAPPGFPDLEEFARDFKRLAGLFVERTQQIRLLGGEPLLNPDINKFLLVARECFPLTEIMIITNGLLLPQMDETFWEVCRENHIVISPTYYPVNFDYDAAAELAKAHDVEYRYFAVKGIKENFWKCVMDSQGLQDCGWNYCRCTAANSCIYLQHGRLYTCPTAPTAHYLNEAFGTQFHESPHDSIDIYQAKSAEEILEFLAKPIPFCRYCRQDIIIHDIPYGQSKRELSEWTL